MGKKRKREDCFVRSWISKAFAIVLFLVILPILPKPRSLETISVASTSALLPEFHEELAVGTQTTLIDVSNTGKGYISAATLSEKITCAGVTYGEKTEWISIPNNGVPICIPLLMGDGEYSVAIAEYMEGSMFSVAYKTDFTAEIEEDLYPFLIPNAYVSYTQDAEYIRFANELAKTARSREDLAELLSHEICSHMTYDINARKGRISDLETSWETGTGVCKDYSALFAAMMRSQGIPTKIVYGDVLQFGRPLGLHAWNEFYGSDGEWHQIDILAPGYLLPKLEYHITEVH